MERLIADDGRRLFVGFIMRQGPIWTADTNSG